MVSLTISFVPFWAIILLLVHVSSGDICTSKICEFTLDIRHARTMTYRWQDKTYNVILNGTELQAEKPDRLGRPLPDMIPVEDVITADGVIRNIFTINGQFPGPAIEVMEGAEVVVHVTNHLLTQATSIHWHGVLQKGTPWMDGVSFISQCPIIPGQSFTYRFYAHPIGTHWYHDHVRNLRNDGLYGMFIVHPRVTPMPEKHVLLSDWHHVEATTLEITNSFIGAGDHTLNPVRREFGPDNISLSPYYFVSALINGKGHYSSNNTPLSVFTLQPGVTYRFRSVNAASKYSFEISIDGHSLDVAAVDGHEVSPVSVGSIILNPGERVDFTIKADQPVGNFWMRSLITRHGTGPNPSDDRIEKGTYAIVRYVGASDSMPTTNRKVCTAQSVCIIFNCPWAGFADGIYKRCIQVDEARSVLPQAKLDAEYGLSGPVDLELFLNMGFHHSPAINGKKFLFPTLPWSEPNYLDGQVTCDKPGCNMAERGCACTQVIHLPFNKTIQLVMANFRPGLAVGHHVMHLHGHNFAVLKLGLPSFNRTTGFANDKMYNSDLKCVNSFCKEVLWNIQNPDLNLENPPVKDTVNVPARGYTVVRFRSTNPGPWFFHCHVSNHALAGMGLIFDEAHDHHAKPPKNFPRCPSFRWSETDFQRYMTGYSGLDSDLKEESPCKKCEVDDREKDDCTLREPTEVNRQTIDIDFLAKHVVLSNSDFIGLIVGCTGVGAALVILVLIIILFRNGTRKSAKISLN